MRDTLYSARIYCSEDAGCPTSSCPTQVFNGCSISKGSLSRDHATNGLEVGDAGTGSGNRIFARVGILKALLTTMASPGDRIVLTGK